MVTEVKKEFSLTNDFLESRFKFPMKVKHNVSFQTIKNLSADHDQCCFRIAEQYFHNFHSTKDLSSQDCLSKLTVFNICFQALVRELRVSRSYLA
jgi:hypothetical protein